MISSITYFKILSLFLSLIQINLIIIDKLSKNERYGFPKIMTSSVIYHKLIDIRIMYQGYLSE